MTQQMLTLITTHVIHFYLILEFYAGLKFKISVDKKRSFFVNGIFVPYSDFSDELSPFSAHNLKFYHRVLKLPRKLNERLKVQQQQKWWKQKNQKNFGAVHLFDTFDNNDAININSIRIHFNRQNHFLSDCN